MAQKISEHMPIILLIVVGLILLVDIINVFALGGPSFFSLIVNPGSVGSTPGSPVPPVTTSMIEGTNIAADTGNSQAIYVPTTATPVPVVSYISVVTPIPEETDHIVYRNLATPTPTLEEDTYALIYAGDLSYYKGEDATAVAVAVREPPLVISYQIAPLMENATRLVGNNSPSAKRAGSTEQLINASYISPSAVFTITVYDSKTGARISQEGFGGSAGLFTENTVTVRDAGSFIVQFDGKFVDAHVDMKIKREGNIV